MCPAFSKHLTLCELIEFPWKFDDIGTAIIPILQIKKQAQKHEVTNSNPHN